MADPRDDRQDDRQPLTRDSDAFLKGGDVPAQGGTSGGTLAQVIGSEDEEKRAIEPDAGTTRVRKADEPALATGNRN